MTTRPLFSTAPTLPFLAIAAMALALPATSFAQQPSGLLDMDTSRSRTSTTVRARCRTGS